MVGMVPAREKGVGPHVRGPDNALSGLPDYPSLYRVEERTFGGFEPFALSSVAVAEVVLNIGRGSLKYWVIPPAFKQGFLRYAH